MNDVICSTAVRGSSEVQFLHRSFHYFCKTDVNAVYLYIESNAVTLNRHMKLIKM